MCMYVCVCVCICIYYVCVICVYMYVYVCVCIYNCITRLAHYLQIVAFTNMLLLRWPSNLTVYINTSLDFT